MQHAGFRMVHPCSVMISPMGLAEGLLVLFRAAVTFDRWDDSTEHGGAMVVLSCLLYAVVYFVLHKE